MRSVEAEFKDGVLRPIRPLHLQSGERVRLVVMRAPQPERWDLARLAGPSQEDEPLSEQGLDEWLEDLEQEDQR